MNGNVLWEFIVDRVFVTVVEILPYRLYGIVGSYVHPLVKIRFESFIGLARLCWAFPKSKLGDER